MRADAGRVIDLDRLANLAPDALEHCHGLIQIKVEAPGSQGVALGVRERADDRDRFQAARVQRQHVTLFRSNTAARSAAVWATSRCAGSPSTSRARSSSTYGSSSRPILSLASSTRRTLASTASWLAAPDSTASGRWAYAASAIAISMSMLTLMARAPASVGLRRTVRHQVAYGVGIAHHEAPEAERVAQHSLNSQRLPVAGIPLRSMYAVMTLPAPASSAARNGGK